MPSKRCIGWQFLPSYGGSEMCADEPHRRAIDALHNALGTICCLVEVGDRQNTIIATADVSGDLHLFACWFAERALKRAKVTDTRCWEVIKVKRAWLVGKATDDRLAAAQAAAGRAAVDARLAAVAVDAQFAEVGATAVDAQFAAVVDARLAAVGATAVDARLAAVGATAWNAAWNAAANKELERRLRRSLGIKGSVTDVK